MRFVLGILFAASAFGQTGGALQPVPIQQPLDNAGRTLQGQCLYTYAAGTTTPQATYSNSALSVPNTNPIVLNGFGREPAVYLSAVSYKIVLAYAVLGSCPVSPGTVIWSQDNVYDFGELLKVTLNGSGGAAQIGFQQAGGSLITVGGAIGSVGIYDLGYSSLSTGCTAASSAPFLISKAWAAVTTQALNCNVNFIPGGRIQPAAAQIVTFTGQVNCPVLQQCFDTTVGGPGSVRFFPNAGGIPGSVGNVSAEWFGAKCTSIQSGVTSDGLINQKALLSAEQAMLNWGANPDMRPLNVGKFTLGQCGVGAYGFPISGTVSLSPAVTFSGTENTATYMFVPSGSFTPSTNGNYVFDTIILEGMGQVPNENFDMGLKNVQIFPSAFNASIIGGVWWGASLRSSLSHLWIQTRGIGVYIPGLDGGTIDNIEVDTYNQACNETISKSQGLVFNDNLADNLINVVSNLKFLWGAANGPPQMDVPLGCDVSGLIYGGLPMLEVGNVNGLVINGAGFEQVMYPVVVHSSYNVKLNSFSTFLDCGATCPFDVPCAAIISSGAQGFHMDLSANHATRGICIGEAWAPTFNYQSPSANLITLIDPYGCVEQTAGMSLTSGATPPAWPGIGCSGTTTDGAITWTAEGPVNIACSPQIQNLTPYLYANFGAQQNCYIPPTQIVQTSGQGSYQQKTPGTMGNSGPSVNGTFEYVYDSDTFWTSPTPQFISVKGVNFNSTADQLVYVNFPTGYTRFLIKSVTLSNSSVALTTARLGVYSGPQLSPGCIWLPGAQSWEVPANAQTSLYSVTLAVETNNTGTSCMGFGTASSGNTYSGIAGYSRTAGFFYLVATVPQGVAATADMTFELTFLP